jgi:tetratricopeptide (TPR) repeat protein
MQGTADKSHRFTICQDIRIKSENVIHLIRKANSFRAGSKKRIEMQREADELLSEIQDLIWVVGKLLNTGKRKEAQVELSIENLQISLHNWMETDLKISVSERQKFIHKKGWEVYKARKFYEVIKEHFDKSERMSIALDESKARLRIAAKEYNEAIKEYDLAIRQLREFQGNKDDSVLSEVLKEIAKSSKEVSELLGEQPSDKMVKEKKELMKKANKKAIEDFGDELSNSTKQSLCGM